MIRIFTLLCFLLTSTLTFAESIDDIDVESTCRINPLNNSWVFTNTGETRVRVEYQVLPEGKLRTVRLNPGQSKTISQRERFGDQLQVSLDDEIRLFSGNDGVCAIESGTILAEASCSDKARRYKWELTNTNTKKVWITRSDNGKSVRIPAATYTETEELIPGTKSIYTSRSIVDFSFGYGDNQQSPVYSMDGDPCFPDPVEPILADIYYIDSEVGVSLATVFAVYLDDQNGTASMERIFEVPFGAHMAVTRDNTTMYLTGGGSLWKYDLINHLLSKVGNLPEGSGSVIQVSINLDDELWAISSTQNIAYLLDPADAAVVESIALDVNITNGDIVFTSDGAILTGKNTLRNVDLSTGTTSSINSLRRNVNGMAVLGQGKSDLIIATKDLDYFITIDPITGEETGTYDAYYNGERFTLSWGDMATGNLYPRFDGCQIYLADQDSRTIYTVSTSAEDEIADANAAFPYPENYRDPHIALNLEGDKLYLISSDQPNKYGYYDLNTLEYLEIGALTGVGKITQLSFSPYGELFFSSNNSEELYVFTDIEAGTYESYGQVRIDNSNNILKIEGSDIAFDQDGTFYVASNQTPDDIYQVSGVKGHLLAVPIVNNLGKHITGLAVDEQGDLLVSFYRSNDLMHISTSTFERTNLAIGGDITRNGYGDMSSACFNLLEYCDGYAEEVIEYNPGTLANGTGTPPEERMVATNALGIPQETDVINFVSLGFGGDMIVELASPVYNFNKNGVYVDNEKSINYGEKSMADIVIVETSYGRRQSNCGPDRNQNYPERIDVYGKQSLEDSEWILLAEGECRSSFIDVAPAIAAGLDFVKYLKLVDITNPQYFPGNADGFDVDGIIICPGEVVAAITGEGRDGSPIANGRTLNDGEAYSEDFFNKAPNEVYQNVFELVSIYPNPVVTNELRLSIESDWDIAQYEIIDINGRIMNFGQVERFNPTITMNSMTNGLYVLKVKVAGQEQAIKFTIKR